MYRLLGILVMVLVLGCSGTQKQETPAPQDNTKVNQTEEKVETPVAGEEKPAPTPAPEPAPADDFEWVYVFESLAVDDESIGKVRAIIEEKWLKSMKYTELKVEDYERDMDKYSGKKVLRAKFAYSYGNYDLSLYSSEIRKDDTGCAEYPIEGPGIPNHRLPRGDDFERFLKEISFLK